MTVRYFAARARAFRAVLVLSALSVCAVPPAFSQTREGRGGRSLFGGVNPQPSGPSGGGSLNATVSISNTYDDDLGGDQGSVSAPQSRIGGNYSNLNTALSFSSKRRRFAITADAATSLRHYPDLDIFVGSNHSAGTTLSANLSPKTSVRARLDGSYVSSFAFDTFTRRSSVGPEGPSLTGLEGAVTDWTMTSYGGAAELTRTLGRRSSFALSYGTRYSERSIVQEYNTERAVAVRFARNTGRDTSVRASYTVREGTQRLMEVGRRVRSHDAQLGVERRWQHSAQRRTVVSLTAGPALLRDEPSVLQTEGTRRLVSAVGSISIRHDLSQSWTAGVSYRRGAGFSSRRVSSNAATVDVRGSAGRRIDLTLSAGYSDGEIGLDAFDNRYKTSFGTARLRVAITRLIAIYGQGFFYHYTFGSLPSLPPGYPRQMDRRALRAGVTLWLPILGR